MVVVAKLEELSVDDFMSGLISGGVLNGMKTWVMSKRLDRGAEAAFFKFKEKAIRPNFRIRCHSMHGDSLAFRDALLAAAQRGLITFDCPETSTIRPAIDAGGASAILAGLPEDEDFWKGLATIFSV
jgi:hypothetical protein